jgi:hypothetical protein
MRRRAAHHALQNPSLITATGETTIGTLVVWRPEPPAGCGNAQRLEVRADANCTSWNRGEAAPERADDEEGLRVTRQRARGQARLLRVARIVDN